MLRRLFLAALLLTAHLQPIPAQSIGQWQVYPSYWIATQNLTVDSRVYGLMNGNLLCYDTSDTSVKTYNSLEHLNDVRIIHMAYSPAAKRLILVYESGNIDLLGLDDQVWNIASLKQSTLANKTVTGITISGTTAYLTTGFGFLTIDMAQAVILDTYNLNLALTGLLVGEEKTYVATSNAVYACPNTANAHIRTNWTSTTEVARTAVAYKPSAYNPAGGLHWHSDGLNGLNGYRLQSDGTYQHAAGPIQPNSPARDLFYRMHYEGDRLLVAGGINTPYAIYNPATAMYWENGKWTNFDETIPATQYPNLNHWNTTHLVQDPNDPTHHFASPYRTGLYEYRDGRLVALYNSENSPLQQILDRGNPLGLNFNSATGLQYDTEGNLWMMNLQTDTIIRVLTPSGQWRALYYEPIEGTETADDYLFSASGVNFLVSRRTGGRGFFGFTTNGTLHTTADDQYVLRTTITNGDGTSYTPDLFYCMAEDLDGQIWCGTNLGLFVILDPTKYFDTDFLFEQIKIARNDGSGLADYLLSGVSVTCIAVDGANRKWIGTSGNGLYLVSADGQEMIHHFQAADSPLLSDNIQCLAIHPRTGLVMIGTDLGLCSYLGDATQAETDLDKDKVLAYPNPVGPEHTGLIIVDGLAMDSEVKITSSTGQLIHSGTSHGGRFTWDGRNKQGRRVASGVYNVIANNSQGSKAVVTRIILIR